MNIAIMRKMDEKSLVGQGTFPEVARRLFRNSVFVLSTVLGLACASPTALRPGDAVWIQWTPEIWYRGRIEKPCEGGFKVRFDDQDEKCSPPEALAKDISPTRVTLEPGMRVLAQKEARIYAPARILEKEGLNFQVRFEDGGISRLSVRFLRLPSTPDGKSLSLSH